MASVPLPDGLLGFSASAGVTAYAAGGAAGATQLTAYVNEVSVVGAANGSVLLPQANPGSMVTVVNDGANSLQVFGNGTDTIAAHNSSSQVSTGAAVAAAAAAIFVCFAPGQWKQILTA